MELERSGKECNVGRGPPGIKADFALKISLLVQWKATYGSRRVFLDPFLVVVVGTPVDFKETEVILVKSGFEVFVCVNFVSFLVNVVRSLGKEMRLDVREQVVKCFSDFFVGD